MLLGDPDIKKALGVQFRKLIQARAVGHGGGDADNFVIGFRQVVQSLDKRIGERNTGHFGFGFTVVRAELSEAMISAGIGLGVRNAFAFNGQHMHQNRAFEALDVLENVY